jgi:hypothetical protein
MEVAQDNLDIYDAVAGTRWERVGEFLDDQDNPIDLTGWTLRGQIRDDDDVLLDEFDFQLQAEPHKFFFGFTPTVQYQGEYDIEAVNGAIVEYLFGGRVRVRRGVTQP